MANQPYSTGSRMLNEPSAVVCERRAALGELCRQLGVGILYVFGSRSIEVRDWLERGTTHLSSGTSDVDIGVKALRGTVWSTREKVELALTLEDFFGCSRVDLVVLDDADPFVAAEIIRGERLYARDSYTADEYDLYVLRRAGDLLPLERERIALILGEPL